MAKGIIAFFLLVDLAAVAWAIVPGMFGYLISDAYQWRSLYVQVFCIPLGVVLFIALGVAIRCDRDQQPPQSRERSSD